MQKNEQYLFYLSVHSSDLLNCKDASRLLVGAVKTRHVAPQVGHYHAQSPRLPRPLAPASEQHAAAPSYQPPIVDGPADLISR